MPTNAEIAKLERAFLKAFRAELKAVDALTDRATKVQTDRCWALADATNKARAALTAARDRAESIVLDDDTFDALSERIENPPAPNARLRALFVKRRSPVPS